MCDRKFDYERLFCWRRIQTICVTLDAEDKIEQAGTNATGERDDILVRSRPLDTN